MKKIILFSILPLLLISNALVAESPSEQDFQEFNDDPNNHHQVTTVTGGYDHIPEYKVIDINLDTTVLNQGPIPVSIHLGAHEPVNPYTFNFSVDGTEKLILHFHPWIPEPESHPLVPTSYRISCCENRQHLYSNIDHCNHPEKAAQDPNKYDSGEYDPSITGYPLASSLGGCLKFNGYDTETSALPLSGPVGQESLQCIIANAFYQLWGVQEGTETLTFVIEKEISFINDKPTFVPFKTFDVQITVLPAFVPTGSDDEEQGL